MHEANYGASKADFINKMQIALKECYETEYWLKLMIRTNLISRTLGEDLLSECGRIRYKLVLSLKTSKNNQD